MSRIENDNYPTDIRLASWTVLRALELAGLVHAPGVIAPGVRMVEPCCGDYVPFIRMGIKAGVDYAVGFDVRQVAPLLTADMEGHVSIRPGVDIADKKHVSGLFNSYEIVATNPPFSIAETVVRTSLCMLNPHGVAGFLVRQSFLTTQKRSQFLMSRPPLEVWMLTKRPSFTRDGKTDMAEYCLAFWCGRTLDRQLDVLGQRFTRMYWLENQHLCLDQEDRVVIEKEGGDGKQEEQDEETET